MSGLFSDIQRNIDELGFISPEITSADSTKITTAPVPGKEEYEWYVNQIFIANDRQARYCFTGDTEVKLLDGTYKRLDWLAENCYAKEFWLYSYDISNNRVVPGLAFHPRVTRKNVPIVKVTLNDGTEIRCTPDHPFLTTMGYYIEAKDLVGHSLESLYTRISKKENKELKSYEMFWDRKKNIWEYTHRNVVNFIGIPIPEKGVIHHKMFLEGSEYQFNKLNNCPENLVGMTVAEHLNYHRKLAIKQWEDPARHEKQRKQFSDLWRTDQRLMENARKMTQEVLPHNPARKAACLEWLHSPEHKELASKINSERWLDVNFRNRTLPKMTEMANCSAHQDAMKNLWSPDSSFRKKMEPILRENAKRVGDKLRGKKKDKEVSKETRQKIALKRTDASLTFEMIENEFIKGCESITECARNLNVFPAKVMRRLNKTGLKNTKEVRQAIASQMFNHVCIKVEDAGYSDVYDLTVYGWHNMAIRCNNVKSPSTKKSAEYSSVFVSQSEYEDMSCYDMISSSLDIYADSATQRDMDGHVLKVITKDNKVQAELEELFYERMDIDSKIWTVTRNVCQYGDLFTELVFDPNLKSVLYFKILPPKSVVRFERDGKLLAFVQNVPGGASPFFDPFEIVHFKVAESYLQFRPYGSSILEPARRPFRQLRLMEDAMVVYRISRAPERRIFYINVGNLPTTQAEAYVQKVRQKFRKKPFINCISLNTLIPLLDGRSLQLKEIIDEHQQGKELWTYSIDRDNNNQIVPGKISWAGITRKNANLVKITIDNGETYVVTPDHQFMLRNGEYKEAKDLLLNDSLMPLNRMVSGKDFKIKGYELVLNPASGKYEFTHIISDFLHEEKVEGQMVRHHKDFNKRNNNPTNIKFMNAEEHIKYHASLMKEKWKDEQYRNMQIARLSEIANSPEHKEATRKKWQNPEYRTMMTKALSTGQIKRHLDNPGLSKEWRRNMKDYLTEDVINRRNESILETYQSKEYTEKERRFFSDFVKNVWKNNPNRKEQYSLFMSETGKLYGGKGAKLKNYFYSKKLTTTYNEWKAGLSNKEITEILNGIPTQEFLNISLVCNTRKEVAKQLKCSEGMVANKIKSLGYNGWTDFKPTLNHKVVKVEFLDYTADTGCITVDKYHNFAVGNGIFVKNSQGEVDQKCVSLDTRIPLLDNRVLTIQELINEHRQGKQNWAFSLSEKGIVPGRIINAQITNNNEKRVRVILDNAKYVDCTADHPFMIRDGSYVRADQLKTNDCLMPLERKISTKEHKMPGYEMVYNPIRNRWDFKHQIVGRELNLYEGTGLLHHSNYDKLNNYPDNLKFMTFEDHGKLHHNNQTPEERKINASKGGKAAWKNLDFRNRKLKQNMECLAPYQTSGTPERNMMDEMVLQARNTIESKAKTSLQALKQWSDPEFKRKVSKAISEGKKGIVTTAMRENGLKTGKKNIAMLNMYRKLHAGIQDKPSFQEWKESYLNHKVIRVEPLPFFEVGDITIENYHNFAIEAGIFIHNSNPFCLTGDTEVPLLDGRTLSIKDLVEEHKQGKENWVYSVDPENGYAPKIEKILRAEKTRENAPLVKITFDNGKSVRCTPDHHFPLRNGTKVKACDLKVGDSMVPLRTAETQISKNAKHKAFYEQVYNIAESRFEFTHRLSARQYIGETKGNVIHHVDLNCKNNNPPNLRLMTWEAHTKLHAINGRENLIKYNKSDAKRKRTSELNRLYNTKQHIIDYNNSEKHAQDNIIRAEALKNTWVEKRDVMIERCILKFDEKVYEYIKNLVEENPNISKEQVAKDLNENLDGHIREINPKYRYLDKQELLSGGLVRKKLQEQGYEHFKDYKRQLFYNHKVVSVEYLEEREDTFNLTVSGSHIYALCAGVFTYNSVDEDFWFPFRPGQEGTKVDTLKGAQNLNEIDDVRYFKDKILAVLKVPRTYLQDTESQKGDRKSNLSQQDIMFARTIDRVQRHVVQGLLKIATVHLILKGFKKEQLFDFRLEMTPCSDIEELTKYEVIEKRLAVAKDYKEQGLPTKWIWQKVLKFSDKEIIELQNERKEEDVIDANHKQTVTSIETPQQPAEGQSADTAALADSENSLENKEEMGVSQENMFKYEDKIKTGHYLSLLQEGELHGINSTEYIELNRTEKDAKTIEEDAKKFVEAEILETAKIRENEKMRHIEEKENIITEGNVFA